MRRDDDLAAGGAERLVLQLHRGSRDWPAARFQPRACELLHGIVPFAACLWGSVAAASPAGTAPALQGLHAQGMDHAQLAALLAGAGLPGFGPPLQAAQLEPLAARRVELQLWRREGEFFGDADRRSLDFLLPHLVEAQRENRLGRTGELAAPARRSHAVCNVEGELLQVDAQFLALLREEWPRWRPPRLPVPLCEALAGASMPPAPALPQRGRHVTVLLSRCGDAVLLEVRRRGAVDRLSRRQREIAERYVAGHSGPQIAALLGLAPSTVNNHLGAIFASWRSAASCNCTARCSPAPARAERALYKSFFRSSRKAPRASRRAGSATWLTLRSMSLRVDSSFQVALPSLRTRFT